MAGPGPLENLRHLAKRYGDVISWKVLGARTYLLVHPKDIESVLVTHHQRFTKGRGTLANPEVFGNGLLTSEGGFWMRQRRLSQPAFNHASIRSYAQTMARRAEDAISYWSEGQSLDIHSRMMSVTLAIAAATLFGVDVGPVTGIISGALKAIGYQNSGLRFWQQVFKIPTLSRWRYLRAARQLDGIVYGIIRQRQRGNGSGDLLSDLLRARDEDGSPMTAQQLRDELVTMLLAGHDTTALALTWTWVLLAQHPAVEQRLHDELDRVLQGRIPDADDTARLVYTNQVIRESMRLYPPAWLITRRAAEQVEIGGYAIPAGANVLISPWLTQRDERFYDRGEAFDPDRWSNGTAKGMPKFAYFPFGGGPRMCIGAGFALMEALILLAVIAQEFRLTLVPGQNLKPWPSITLRPISGVRVQVMAREAATSIAKAEVHRSN
jgi:cytochrome P450